MDKNGTTNYDKFCRYGDAKCHKIIAPDYISGKAFFFHSLEATLKTVVFVIYSSR
jgi:hypothetical protein